jgi:hypothetical protein
MLKRIIQLQDIAGVTAGGTAIINCPIGYRYHDIHLVASGGADLTPATCVGNITCKLGSKVQRRITASHLDIVNSLQGSAYAANTFLTGTSEQYHIPMFFGEPWRKRVTDQDALAWQTGWLGKNGTFQIEVELLAAATSPKLTAFATVDDFDSGKPHGIMKYYSYNFGAPNSENASVVTLDRRDFYSQISVIGISDSFISAISRSKLTVSGVEVFHQNSRENYAWLKSRGMNPNALTSGEVVDGSSFHIVFEFSPPAWGWSASRW